LLANADFVIENFKTDTLGSDRLPLFINELSRLKVKKQQRDKENSSSEESEGEDSTTTSVDSTMAALNNLRNSLVDIKLEQIKESKDKPTQAIRLLINIATQFKFLDIKQK